MTDTKKDLKQKLENLLSQINDTNTLLHNNPYPRFLTFLHDINIKLDTQQKKWKNEKIKLQKELKKLLDMMNEREIDFEQLINLKKKVNQLNDEINRHKNEINTLQRQNDEYKSQLKANELISNANDNDKDTLIRELQTYKDTIGVQNEREVERLTTETGELKSMNDELRQIIKDKDVCGYFVYNIISFLCLCLW